MRDVSCPCGASVAKVAAVKFTPDSRVETRFCKCGQGLRVQWTRVFWEQEVDVNAWARRRGWLEEPYLVTVDHEDYAGPPTVEPLERLSSSLLLAA